MIDMAAHPENKPRDTPASDLASLRPGITTLILTYNEEMHIERAIASARAISHEIVVVDSYSTDQTVQLALKMGARVLQNPWTNHSKQLQWALMHGGIATEWTLRLDADELIGPDLSARINRELPNLSPDVGGVILNRRHIFMGKWVRHGGRYPLYLLRLWRTGRGRVEDRWMDEHIILDGGSTVYMSGEFADASERDLTFFIAKHNDYASREAIETLNQRYGMLPEREGGMNGSGSQAKIKRMVKERLYNRLPFGVGPVSYFIYRYVFQLGFTDGPTGTIYHALQGFWYRFLVDAKTLEFDRAIKCCSTNEERLAVLTRVSGLRL